MKLQNIKEYRIPNIILIIKQLNLGMPKFERQQYCITNAGIVVFRQKVATLPAWPGRDRVP